MNRKACFRATALVAAVFLVSTVLAASPDVSEYPEVSGNDLRWHFDAEHGGAELLVVRPDGRVVARSAPAGEQAIAFSLAEDDQPEGTYLWELSLAPRLTADQRSELERARREGAEPVLEEPVQGRRTQGSFRIVEGEIHGIFGAPSKEAGTVERADDGVYSPLDQVVNDDQVVQGSLCVGLNCVDGESFGFDTIRLKEDNLRIAFVDSSTATGFPSGDWQVRINESTSGGGDFFAVEWLGTASGGGANNSPVSTPFRIEGGAANNALYIESSGDVGLGTPSPVLNLHLRDGDTPGLRLEQDTSSGFGAQTWDIAANETSFFVRDASNGSTLPFRVFPGVPSNTLVVRNGSVGVGTTSPEAPLHVVGDARIEGALYQLSSRSAKTGFDRPDASTLLSEIEQLDIGFWRYKGKADADRHFGPTAEDFHAAFGLGGDERHISVSDMAGIALGATQALKEEIRRRDETIAELTRRLERLEAAFDSAPAR